MSKKFSNNIRSISKTEKANIEIEKINLSIKNLQYHANNRHATWLELFFDLVFVASISVVTHNFAHTHHGHIELKQLLLFPVEFLPIWWIWATHMLYANRFDTDSRQHRLTSLAIMFLVITMSAFLDGGMFAHYKYFVGFYIAIRLILAGLYLSSPYKLTNSNNYTKVVGLNIIAGACVSSICLVSTSPISEAILVGSILFEMIGVVLIGKKVKVDPIHREHFVERIGLFCIILLGESVISLITSLKNIEWNHLNITAALSGFIMIGSIWWIFYDRFHDVERIKNMQHGYTLLYSNILFASGLIILANLIRHTILNDLNMHDFQILTLLGVTSFFIGKQTNYYRFFPPMRPYILINSVACISITIASTFLPRPEYALVGMTLSMLFYVFVNYMWTMKKDISEYLE